MNITIRCTYRLRHIKVGGSAIIINNVPEGVDHKKRRELQMISERRGGQRAFDGMSINSSSNGYRIVIKKTGFVVKEIHHEKRSIIINLQDPSPSSGITIYLDPTIL